jgi:lipid A 4'-phosphatase
MSKAEPWPLWQKIAAPIAAIVIAAEILPAIDLLTSGWAYRAGAGGFWLRDALIPQIVYHGTRYITIAMVIGLIGVIVYGLLDSAASRRAMARRAGLVLLAMAIGPGLIVHTVLKDHWGRPRPAQIADFGGTGHYVAPGIPSNQCDHNCSFVSGHASSGYILVALGLLWPLQRRRWLWIGLGVGTFIGFIRIIQGAHFFSDVLGAGVVAVGTTWLVEWQARSRGWLDLPKR